MTRRALHFAPLAVLAFAAASCAGPPAGDSSGKAPDSAAVEPAPAAATATLTGTVTYRQRIALPPEAEVTVTLADVSRADAAAVPLGSSTFKADGRQVPLPYTITYDPGSVDERMTYAVSARIEIGGKLAWISDTHTQALTRGAAADSIEIVVRPVGG